MARMNTIFGAVPVTMKPPIPTDIDRAQPADGSRGSSAWVTPRWCWGWCRELGSRSCRGGLLMLGLGVRPGLELELEWRYGGVVGVGVGVGVPVGSGLARCCKMMGQSIRSNSPEAPSIVTTGQPNARVPSLSTGKLRRAVMKRNACAPGIGPLDRRCPLRSMGSAGSTAAKHPHLAIHHDCACFAGCSPDVSDRRPGTATGSYLNDSALSMRVAPVRGSSRRRYR